MGGGGGVSGDIRNQQRQNEFLINEGMRQLDAVFGGGTYTPYTRFTGTPVAGGQYFTIDANTGKYAPYTFQPNKPAPYGGYGESRTKPLVSQGKFTKTLPDLYTGGTPVKYGGFTPEFFAERQRTFENTQMPALGKQYRNAMANVISNMGNRGLLKSSAARNLKTSLNEEMETQRQGIANAALASSQDLKGQIAQEKMNLTNQLITSANPQIAAQGALEAASRFSTPSPIPAAGNFFNNWMNMYLGQSLANQYTQYNNQLMGQLFPYSQAATGGGTAGASAPVSYTVN